MGAFTVAETGVGVDGDGSVRAMVPGPWKTLSRATHRRPHTCQSISSLTRRRFLSVFHLL